MSIKATEKIWTPPELVHVPVEDMDAFFRTPW